MHDLANNLTTGLDSLSFSNWIDHYFHFGLCAKKTGRDSLIAPLLIFTANCCGWAVRPIGSTLPNILQNFGLLLQDGTVSWKGTGLILQNEAIYAVWTHTVSDGVGEADLFRVRPARHMPWSWAKPSQRAQRTGWLPRMRAQATGQPKIGQGRGTTEVPASSVITIQTGTSPVSVYESVIGTWWFSRDIIATISQRKSPM